MGIMIGKVKGYSVCDISKGTLKKEEFFNEIENRDSNIREKLESVLQNKGLVFGLKKDKKLKAVYIFESANEDKKKILRFTEKILLDEIDNEIQEKFEKDLINEFKELVSLEEYAKVEWNENVIVPKTLKVGKHSVPIGSLIFLLFIIFGIIIDDVAIGMCMGLAFGCGYAIIVKRKDDDENKTQK